MAQLLLYVVLGYLTYSVVDTDVDLALAGVDLGSREGANLDPDEQKVQREK